MSRTEIERKAITGEPRGGAEKRAKKNAASDRTIAQSRRVSDKKYAFVLADNQPIPLTNRPSAHLIIFSLFLTSDRPVKEGTLGVKSTVKRTVKLFTGLIALYHFARKICNIQNL